MGLFVREFHIASPTLPLRKICIDMRTISIIEELDPRKNSDKARCVIDTEVRPDPILLADPYEEVREEWVKALRAWESQMGQESVDDEDDEAPKRSSSILLVKKERT